MAHEETECCGPDCPQCRAMADQCAAVSGIAMTLEQMLDRGVFEALGAEMVRRREEAFLAAFLGGPLAETPTVVEGGRT